MPRKKRVIDTAEADAGLEGLSRLELIVRVQEAREETRRVAARAADTVAAAEGAGRNVRVRLHQMTLLELIAELERWTENTNWVQELLSRSGKVDDTTGLSRLAFLLSVLKAEVTCVLTNNGEKAKTNSGRQSDAHAVDIYAFERAVAQLRAESERLPEESVTGRVTRERRRGRRNVDTDPSPF